MLGSPEAITVAVSGAAGQIGERIVGELFRFESPPFGSQNINLRLLETPSAVARLTGVALETEDLASPYLGDIECTDDPRSAFDGADLIFLAGAAPRREGMERSDLIKANGSIFVEHGRAINDSADDDVRVVVVGNPANTNALIALSNAPDVPVERFSAMSRLDHNRARAALGYLVGQNPWEIEDLVVWGNHSDTMVVDASNAFLRNLAEPEGNIVNILTAEQLEDWQDEIRGRGKAVIAARGGTSSAMSAARAAVDQAHSWLRGSTAHSMAVMSHGEYGAPAGVVFSTWGQSEFGKGNFVILEDFKLTEAVKRGIEVTGAELLREKDQVKQLGFLAVER